MVRKISSDKYIVAAVLTILIFSLGFSLGIIIDNFRIKDVEQNNRKQEVDYASLQMQYLYLSSLEHDAQNCAVLSKALEEIVAQLGESLDEFLEYKKETQLNKEQYLIAHRKYLIDNIRYWFFATKTQEKCEMDLTTVLYFYSGENCDVCPDQGFVLTYFKNLYQERLLIFPIDVDMQEDEPLISMLVSKYDVTKFPTIIMDGAKHEGFIAKDDMSELICDSFNNTDLCLS